MPVPVGDDVSIPKRGIPTAGKDREPSGRNAVDFDKGIGTYDS